MPAHALSPELLSYLQALPEPHIVVDGRYRVVAANVAYRRQFSAGQDVAGRLCHEVSHGYDQPCDRSGETCPMAAARVSQQRERVVHLHHTPRGDAYVQVELIPLHDARGQARFFVEKMCPLPGAHGQATASGLVGRSAAFQRMLSLVARVGPSDASVLLLGESGTGKELVARAVHEASARAAAPLVVVDCASLPETLFESELFGHERGAFTGASAAKAGLVEAASGGTLFLDEVGDIPLTLQVKLLRLLESGTYRRVGSTELRHADVRVVSATHRDLQAMVADGRFREDLYWRLSTFPIRLPPLRERLDDVPLLVEALLRRLAPRRHLAVSPAALQRLARHRFAGNVRELRNVLERAALLCDGEWIDAVQVDEALGGGMAPAPQPLRGVDGPAAPPAAAAAGSAPTSLREAEQAWLRERLQRHQGTRAALARELGLSERSLYRRLRAMVLTEPKA